VEFEPTILVFERAKTVHVLDRAATIIGNVEVCVYWIDSISTSKAGFKGGGSEPLPWGVHKTETESADFTETTASLKPVDNGMSF
jgi:hypothetical protein